VIDVIVADHQELFHVGMIEVLAGADDICLLAQPRSAEQLLSLLETVVPHVLVLSTDFLPTFSKIEPVLKRRRTALLILAEENDRITYVRWWRASGIVYRSADGPVMVDALRRVASGELFLQNGSSDIKDGPSAVSQRLTDSKNRVPIILSVGEDSAILYEHYRVLQDAGYGVLSATEGDHALSMFEAYPVDLVLLDHAMRGTDGELIVHKIRRCKQNVPVIAVSAEPIPEETLSCADCVVTKEQGSLQLLQKIGQLLMLPTGRDTGML
jgi:DNA-binding NarL/FixJ family response regulator